MQTYSARRTTLGYLEVICGPMFSGKSEELIKRLQRAKIAKQTVLAFKDYQHNHAIEYIISHDGNKISARPIGAVQEIIHIAEQEHADVICIDNAHFFSQKIIPTICELIKKEKRVIVAGLDLDFRGIPFGPIPTLLALADSITKLHAICSLCGNNGHFTQRLINGRPAHYDDPIIMIGAQETYQARCRQCYYIDKAAPFMSLEHYESNTEKII
ncbi:MAG TPA: thymidine kinase [Candidatus Babeliales bacterium]|nr:thymidine kinase [Candidatus Babeliales bacterium]